MGSLHDRVYLLDRPIRTHATAEGRVLTPFVLRDQPTPRRQGAAGRIRYKLCTWDHILRPKGGVANVIDSVEGGPDVAVLTLRWSVILPAHSGALQQVSKRLKFKTGKLLRSFPSGVHYRDSGAAIGIAAPGLDLDRHVWVIDGTAGLRTHRIQMIGKTSTFKRREHVVAQRKVPSIGPVIRNVILRQLAIS